MISCDCITPKVIFFNPTVLSKHGIALFAHFQDCYLKNNSNQ